MKYERWIASRSGAAVETTLAQGPAMPGDRERPATAPLARPWNATPGARPRRTLYRVYVALAWMGVVAGFSPGLVRHLTGAVPPPPLVIHVHGIVMVTWLCLVTLQIALVGRGQARWHRRLGLASLPLALAVVGATVWVSVAMTRAEYPVDGNDALAFFYNELNDAAIFVVLTGSALVARRRPEVHRRLMLLSLLFVTAPGFARSVGRAAAHLAIGHPDIELWTHLFVGPDLLMLSAVFIDWRARRQLHSTYRVAVPLLLVNQAIICLVVNGPAWPDIARHLLSLK